VAPGRKNTGKPSGPVHPARLGESHQPKAALAAIARCIPIVLDRYGDRTA